jgi:hypothetical protein
MDKTVVGVVGAISGFALAGSAQAAPNPDVNANTTSIRNPQSFAELLQPIPNAAETLRAIGAANSARTVDEGDVQLAQYHHHHHHHHHRFYHHHHHHHWRPRWWYRHHHHHHHHHHHY